MKHLLLLILGIALFFSCKKEQLITDSSAKLEFSVDTLRFDTVFTELGSATRIVKILNKHDQPIKISKIYLKNGSQSLFNLNVDGISGDEAQDVEIAANDSLYVFAEVTINPDNPLSVSPFIINDAIVFETNGNVQNVVLEAFGQNANYIPNRWGKGGFAEITQNTTWDDPKPYVIYGVLLVDSSTLTIPAGARVYVHGGLSRLDDTILYNDGILYILPLGKLVINGTLDNPVTIQGDRLEEEFQNTQGQWSGIRISAGSKGNIFQYTTIKNSIVGVRVDSSANLIMKNVQIANTASDGIIGIHSTITAENCLVYNNGGNSARLLFGGDYHFSYCTLANYGNDASSLNMNNYVCLDPNDINCSNFQAYRLNALFENCILFGSQADEIDLSDRFGGQDPAKFNYHLDHCIVRVQKLVNADNHPEFFTAGYCDPCINANGTQKLFKKISEEDYHLDTLSIAEKQAFPILSIMKDLEGHDRDNATPDIGCYEYQY